MYTMYMTYTVAEFKKNTRRILNEALISPVTIKRYDDEFILTTAKLLSTKITQEKMVPEVASKIFTKEPHREVKAGSWKSQYQCEHFQDKGQCLVKGCKFGRGKR